MSLICDNCKRRIRPDEVNKLDMRKDNPDTHELEWDDDYRDMDFCPRCRRTINIIVEMGYDKQMRMMALLKLHVKRVGTPDKTGGTPDRIEGTHDKIEGMHDKIEGTHDKIEGMDDRIEGTHEKTEGTHDKVDGTDEPGQRVKRKYTRRKKTEGTPDETGGTHEPGQRVKRKYTRRKKTAPSDGDAEKVMRLYDDGNEPLAISGITGMDEDAVQSIILEKKKKPKATARAKYNWSTPKIGAPGRLTEEIAAAEAPGE